VSFYRCLGQLGAVGSNNSAGESWWKSRIPGTFVASPSTVPRKCSFSAMRPSALRGEARPFSPDRSRRRGPRHVHADVMGMRARERSHPLEGTKIVVQKHMTAAAPRRIAKLNVQVSLPHGDELSDADRQVLIQAAHTCPLRPGILEAIDVPVGSLWGSEPAIAASRSANLGRLRGRRAVGFTGELPHARHGL
jgi:putative redox protein